MYKKKINEIITVLNSDSDAGLSTAEVLTRQKKYGLNKLNSKKRKNPIIIFLSTFLDWLVIILLLAAFISILVDPSDYIESIIILGVLILNSLIDTIEQIKTQSSLDSLKKLSESKVEVLRDKGRIFVNSTELVPGDIVYFKKGDIVSADCRIITCNNIEVDESSITGESLGVHKNNQEIYTHRSVHNQDNMLFSSSSILKGNCKCIVVSTGVNSTLGEIAKNLNNDVKLSPLQIKLNTLAKYIGIMCIFICILVFCLEILTKSDYLSALKSAIALSVAAIPEGLACIVTLVLTIGVSKMAKRNVIVKKLDKVETLGSVNIICTDKTGTLTENKMRLEGVYTDYYSNLNSLPLESIKCLKYANLAINHEDIDPTDKSIIEGSAKLPKLEHKLLKIIPFDSKSKMLKVIVEINNKKILIVKGAFDYLIKHSEYKERWYKAHEELASQGLRIICVAYKDVSNLDDSLNGVKILGLLAIKDNLRENIAQSVKGAKKAKIRTIMITGDHKTTATAIAKEACILEDGYEVITSEELSLLSDDELYENITKYSVYARMTPFDKLRVIKAWQSRNLVVAMTGDGVNDSIALNQADCGIALGSGCDVSKEASDLVIVDDNYESIINGVKEGRRVYDNICKCVKYLLASNIGEVLSILIVSIISLVTNIHYGVTLAPIHLLFVNLITDSLPAFALGLEKESRNIMNKPPKKMNESIINKRIGFEIISNGIVISFITIVSFLIGSRIDHITGMTMAFLTLSLSQLIHAYNCKSNSSIFSFRSFNNKVLNLSFLFGLGISLFVIYSPYNHMLKLTELNLSQIITVSLLACMCIVSSEFVKSIKFKNKNNLFYF